MGRVTSSAGPLPLLSSDLQYRLSPVHSAEAVCISKVHRKSSWNHEQIPACILRRVLGCMDVKGETSLFSSNIIHSCINIIENTEYWSCHQSPPEIKDEEASNRKTDWKKSKHFQDQLTIEAFQEETSLHGMCSQARRANWAEVHTGHVTNPLYITTVWTWWGYEDRVDSNDGSLRDSWILKAPCFQMPSKSHTPPLLHQRALLHGHGQVYAGPFSFRQHVCRLQVRWDGMEGHAMQGLHPCLQRRKIQHTGDKNMGWDWTSSDEAFKCRSPTDT